MLETLCSCFWFSSLAAGTVWHRCHLLGAGHWAGGRRDGPGPLGWEPLQFTIFVQFLGFSFIRTLLPLPSAFFFFFFFSYPKFLSILFSNFVKRTILQHWSFLKGFLAPLLSSFLLSLSTQSKDQGVRAPPKYPQGGRNSLISWRVSLGARGMCSHWALPLHLSDRIWGSPASSLPCHEQRNTW